MTAETELEQLRGGSSQDFFTSQILELNSTTTHTVFQKKRNSRHTSFQSEVQFDSSSSSWCIINHYHWSSRALLSWNPNVTRGWHASATPFPRGELPMSHTPSFYSSRLQFREDIGPSKKRGKTCLNPQLLTMFTTLSHSTMIDNDDDPCSWIKRHGFVRSHTHTSLINSPV